jgi:hypothetical protein
MTYATLELSVVCTVGTVPFSTTEFHSFVRKEGFFTARCALIPRALHLKTGACAARYKIGQEKNGISQTTYLKVLAMGFSRFTLSLDDSLTQTPLHTTDSLLD